MKTTMYEVSNNGMIIEHFEVDLENKTCNCSYCGGSGIRNNYRWHDNGFCYKCKGTGRQKLRIPVNKLYNKETAKKLADKILTKRKEKLNKWREEYPYIYICVDSKANNKMEELKANGFKWVLNPLEEKNRWIGFKEVNGLKFKKINSRYFNGIKVNEYNIKYADIDMKEEKIIGNIKEENKEEYTGINEGAEITINGVTNIRETIVNNNYIYTFNDVIDNCYLLNSNCKINIDKNIIAVVKENNKPFIFVLKEIKSLV